MSVIKAIGYKLFVAVACAGLLSSAVTVVFGFTCLAASAVFGDQAPPVPWYILRFFLALAWMLSAFVGLLASKGPRK